METGVSLESGLTAVWNVEEETELDSGHVTVLPQSTGDCTARGLTT